MKRGRKRKVAEVIETISCNFEFSDAPGLDTHTGSASPSGWTFSDAPQLQLTVDLLGSLIPV